MVPDVSFLDKSILESVSRLFFSQGSYFNVDLLFSSTCIPHLNVFRLQMASQLKDLAGKLRNIVGVQSLASGKKKGGSTSVAGDVESSGFRDLPVKTMPIIDEAVPVFDDHVVTGGTPEAAKEVTRFLEKNRKLKKELERRPTPEKVL